MSLLRRRWLLGLAMLMVCCGAGADDAGLSEARALFARYQHLERSFDPSLASLYADDAVIWVTRIYSNGVERQLKIPAELYRLAVRDSMTKAAERGDFNDYSHIRYLPQADGVRIEATRYNHWRDYRSPYVALVRPATDGTWRIVEEHFQTRVPHPATP